MSTLEVSYHLEVGFLFIFQRGKLCLAVLFLYSPFKKIRRFNLAPLSKKIGVLQVFLVTSYKIYAYIIYSAMVAFPMNLRLPTHHSTILHRYL